MEDINWVTVVIKIFDTKGHTNPIVEGERTFEFAVFGLNESKMGFMMVWETQSRRAIRVSRMEIPSGMEFYSMEDESHFKGIVPGDLLIEEAVP